MAKTAYAATANEVVKKWSLVSKKIFRDAIKESYFGPKMMGPGTNNVVMTDDGLSKGPGDRMRFVMRDRLSGAGVTEGQSLEGNEEALNTNTFDLTLHQYRHAVRDNGAMDRKRAMFSISQESVSALKDWGAEKIDYLLFDQLFGIADGSALNRIFYATGSAASTITTTTTSATAKSALTTSSNLTPTMLDYVKAWAVTGGNRTQTPIKPVKIDGKNYYIFLAHPFVYYDLRQNSTWLQAVREALERSPKNPIFSGALGVWNGIVLHEHENCPAAADAGSGSDVPWSKAAFMGAGALAWAWGQEGKLVTKKFDYDNEEGHAWEMIAAAGRPNFDSKDYGALGVYLANTNIGSSLS